MESNPFVNPNQRGVELPPGCKDLMDVLKKEESGRQGLNPRRSAVNVGPEYSPAVTTPFHPGPRRNGYKPESCNSVACHVAGSFRTTRTSVTTETSWQAGATDSRTPDNTLQIPRPA